MRTKYLAAIAVLAARRSGTSTLDVAYSDVDLVSGIDGTYGVFVSQVPLRIAIDRRAGFAANVAAVASAREDLLRRGPLALELLARDPGLRASTRTEGMREATMSIGVGVDPPPSGVRFGVSADGSSS